MKVTSAVEVRTARPVYFSGSKESKINLSVMSGQGYVTRTTRVKVHRLASGQYSIRCLGGGLTKTLHVYPKTFVVMVTETGAHRFGNIEDLFSEAMKA